MREYGKVSPQFWIGSTGKSLRGHMEAQIVAMYLITSPHATMTGVFHMPLQYLAYETGLPLEGAWKGLARLLEGGFCTYDEGSEWVWVHEMARFQVAEELKPADNRVKALQREVENIPETRIRTAFHRKYAERFSLAPLKGLTKGLARGSKAPPKPRAEQEQSRSKDLSGKPDAAAEVLAHLNTQAGRKFDDCDANRKLIEARMKAGATVDDCKAVIDDRVMAWARDPKMAEYLRPATLFAATNFAQYRGNLGMRSGAGDTIFTGAK